MRRRLFTLAFAGLALGTVTFAQGQRPASPARSTSAQVGGKWIDVTYGGPLKKGRDLWGSGAEYGKLVNSGAPVWRAGANQTTRLKTEVPLTIGATTLPAGDYSVMIDIKPNDWTFIASTQAAQTTYDPKNTTELWGSFNYTPAKDVVRAKMTLGVLPMSIEQLTWAFSDVTDAGGTLQIMWDKVVASVPFKVVK